MPGVFFPGGIPTSAQEPHTHPDAFVTWMAINSLNIQEGYKLAVFYKDTVWYSNPPIEIQYEVSADNPHFIGYIYPNARFSHLSKIYNLMPQSGLFEHDDKKNTNRSKHVYADGIFRDQRRFGGGILSTTPEPERSSIIDGTEAITHVAQWLLTLESTKEMISKVFAGRQFFTVFQGSGPNDVNPTGGTGTTTTTDTKTTTTKEDT